MVLCNITIYYCDDIFSGSTVSCWSPRLLTNYTLQLQAIFFLNTGCFKKETIINYLSNKIVI